MKKIFVSFASSDMIKSLNRISRQADEMKTYDSIITMTENDLNDEFTAEFSNKLKIGSRGFGYWCWKPQIILQILNTTKKGDLIQYTDAGCHLNFKGQWRLAEYFNIVHNCKNGILAFQAKAPDGKLFNDKIPWLDLVEKKWAKGDLLDYLNVRNRQDIINTQSIGAGIIFIKNCEESKKIIESWLQVIREDFHYIDDTPSFSPNLEGFIEHRHDQSIFSILCKINSIETISAYEYWYPKKNFKGPDWEILDTYPIHAKRDKNFRLYRKFVTTTQRIIKKLFRTVNELRTL